MKNIIQVIYDLLALIEFTSSRKRMSVLVKTKEGKILLLSKGADSVIMARLADDQKGATIEAQKMIDEVSPGRVTINYHINPVCERRTSHDGTWNERGEQSNGAENVKN